MAVEAPRGHSRPNPPLRPLRLSEADPGDTGRYGDRVRDDGGLVNVLVFLVDVGEVTVQPAWEEVDGSWVLTYRPARLVDDYWSAVVPREGEHVVMGSPAVVNGPTYARVVSVIHHWTEAEGGAAHVIARRVDPAVPLTLG